MPGKDQEYQYQRHQPDSNIASKQQSGNVSGDGAKESLPQQQIMQKENMKNKGSNKFRRDGKTGTEQGAKK
ncbi:MAG TPA: hypothetical protein VF145_11190 [Chitinophagaceae bacterium]